jgi:hypothetical protein
MITLKIIFWILVLAFFQALQETQIEGKAGWARHLPTFRISTFVTKIFLSKEITGYHIYMLLMFVTIFHGIFLFQEWSIKNELLIFGLLNWYFVIEDFLFFIVNPHYRFKNFRKGKISWHKRWIFNLIPVSYAWGMIIGTGLLLLGGR